MFVQLGPLTCWKSFSLPAGASGVGEQPAGEHWAETVRLTKRWVPFGQPHGPVAAT